MEWQPIETAPKDGKRILLFHHYAVIGGWRNLWYRQGGADMHGWVCTEGEIGNQIRGVTHWMELPQDPKEIEDD